MNKVYLYKSIIPFCVLVSGIIFGLGCTDIPSTGPDLPDLIAQFRFLNAAEDVGNVGITVDKTSVGTLDYKATTSYQQFNAGSRVITLSTDDTLRIAMPTYRRGTIVILPKTGVVREYIRLIDRRTFDSTELDTGIVRIANAATAELDVTISNTDASVSVTETLGTGEDTGYLHLPLGQYSISAIAAGDTTATVIASSSSVTVTNKRSTSVILGTHTNSLSITNLNDD